MSDDAQAIRQVVDTWFTASQRGDLAAILDLMTEDVVFMVPGQEPFGKAAFAAAFKGMGGVKMEGSNQIVELEVRGEWAYIRNHINLTITPPDGKAIRRAGYTLTLLTKDAGGRWRLSRDANLLTLQA